MSNVAHPFVYAVRSGLLKLSYVGEDGNEWIKSFVCEGQFFASMSALSPSGRTSFMATAIETCSLEQIDYRSLNELAASELSWSRALHISTMVFAAKKENRERELLTLKPEQRFLAFRAAYPMLQNRIPQKDLARHLGLTPVGLNRIISRTRSALS